MTFKRLDYKERERERENYAYNIYISIYTCYLKRTRRNFFILFFSYGLSCKGENWNMKRKKSYLRNGNRTQ